MIWKQIVMFWQFKQNIFLSESTSIKNTSTGSGWCGKHADDLSNVALLLTIAQFV